MSGGRDDDERRALERALAGVKPLPGRDAKVVPKRPKPAPGARSAGDGEGASTDTAPSHSAAPAPFTNLSSGERLEGVAGGIDRKWLRRLRSGDVEVDEKLDLHGHTAPAARAAVTRTLRAAHEAGRRCVLVVHGRGARSEDGPVLKALLVPWLTESRIAPLVMAFTSARAEHGGPGATYVLLRRKRPSPPAG